MGRSGNTNLDVEEIIGDESDDGKVTAYQTSQRNPSTSIFNKQVTVEQSERYNDAHCTCTVTVHGVQD